jgi:hypothetical protein
MNEDELALLINYGRFERLQMKRVEVKQKIDQRIRSNPGVRVDRLGLKEHQQWKGASKV